MEAGKDTVRWDDVRNNGRDKRAGRIGKLDKVTEGETPGEIYPKANLLIYLNKHSPVV